MAYYAFTFEYTQLCRLSNNGMDKVAGPIDSRPEALASPLLGGRAEFRFDPFASAFFDLFRRTPHRRRARPFRFLRHTARQLGDVANRPKTGLNLNMPSADRSFRIMADSQEIDFLDAVFDSTDSEEAVSVQPFFDKTFRQ